MRNNKILAAAVASALSLSAGAVLLGASTAFAADFELWEPGGGSLTDTSVTAPIFATQLFPGTSIASSLAVATACGSGNSFVVKYRIPLVEDVANGDVLKVKASLSGGASWGGAVNALTQVGFCTTNGLLCSNGLNVEDVTISKSSAVADADLGVVEFAIQSIAAISKDSAFFFFCPDVDAPFLSQEGSSLFLSMESSISKQGSSIPLGAKAELKIASSAAGSMVEILAATTGYAAIDFASDSIKFSVGATKGTAAATDRVSLGTIEIKNATPPAMNRDGTTTYIFDPTVMTGKLVIIDGIFAASMAANQVFLDDDGTCQFDTTKDIAATTVTETVAEWSTLSGDNLGKLDNGSPMHVCVVTDGVKTINEQPRPPLATLSMGPTGQEMSTYSARLRHIKENGTKCSLYNIPDGTETLGTNLSTDVVSVRITNNGPDTGKLFATLYDQSGQTIYTPTKRVAIGEIAPFQTIRYYTGQENSEGYDPAKDLATLGGAQHWVGQRATLVIATDLEDVSIFGLVRNRNSGPNMNMSTGATGNGCD